MTEFDQIKAAERIAELAREHGDELTTQQVRVLAKRTARAHDISIQDAFDMIEAMLLDSPPDRQDSELWP